MNTIASNNLNAIKTDTALSPSRANQAFRRLCLKELRQCLPLATAIVAVSVVLHLLVNLSYQDIAMQMSSHAIIFVLTPCLFGIGAGALLVSQEKEMRSIGWLSSLPISHRNILTAKLIAAFTSLACVWMINFVYLAIFGIDPSFRPTPEPITMPVLFAVLNSIFLTLLGFLTAWRFQSTLVALVMIVPLGILQSSTVILFQIWSKEERIPDWMVAGNYVLFSALAFWYGWRSGLGYLSSRPSTIPWQAMLVNQPAAATYKNYLYARTLGPVPSLVWQFAAQNRMLVAASVIMVASPVFCLMFLSREDRINFPLPLMIHWLIASWLGATVFQSDATQQRIRFLAERGVKPSTVWWTRQFIPLSLAVVSAAILVFYFRDLIRTQVNSTRYGSQPFPLLVLGAPIMLLIHAAAQWQGQLIRSPIVSLLAAPATVLVAVGYAAFAVATLGSPFWLIFVSIAIAIAATRIMMPAWMDGRTGLRYWTAHGSMLALALIIPALPFVYTYLTYPTMPASDLRAFQSEAKTAGKLASPYELVIRIRKPAENEGIGALSGAIDGDMGMMGSSEVGGESSGSAELSPDSAVQQGDDALNAAGGAVVDGSDDAVMDNDKEPWQLIDVSKLSFAELIVANVNDLEKQLAEHPGPIRYSPAVQFLLSETTLMRLNLDKSPTNQANVERYRRAMRVLHDVVGRLRLSWRLIDQSVADQVERAMLADMQRKDAREVLGTTNYNAIAKTLADKQARKQARRRAIVLSWTEVNPRKGDPDYTRRSRSFDFGGYGQVTEITNDLNSQIIAVRRVSRLAWLLSRYLESKDQTEADQRFAEVSKEWDVAVTRNKYSTNLFRYIRIPGTDWLGEWEDEAEKLK